MSKTVKTIGVIAAIMIVAVVAFFLFRSILDMVMTGAVTSSSDAASSLDSGGGSESAVAESPDSGGEDQISVDPNGRRIITPAAGNPKPLTKKPVESKNRCDISPELTIQTMGENAEAEIMWSKTAGPSKYNGVIPTGYSADATGAALAAWNYRTLFYGGGKFTDTVVRDHVEFKPSDRDGILAEDYSNVEAYPAGFGTLAPVAARIITCKPDFMVVEHAHKMIGDGEKFYAENDPHYDIHRFTMKLSKDGEWIFYMPGMVQGIAVLHSLDGGWTMWQY
ncbi:MAG: hypothetical protein ACFNXY_05310 [Corynebacterium matruchotii]|uniref:hypothetical protein n=1 Tax=Corynebacterium matruchotii TaxID=43768 RepID=UPI00361968AA